MQVRSAPLHSIPEQRRNAVDGPPRRSGYSDVGRRPESTEAPVERVHQGELLERREPRNYADLLREARLRTVGPNATEPLQPPALPTARRAHSAYSANSVTAYTERRFDGYA